MAATVESIVIVVKDDPDGDASYLEQEEFAFRLEEYYRGEFGFIGVQCEAELRIPYGQDWIIQRITSPGLWSIESDSGEDYIREVGREEYATLREMLAELGVDPGLHDLDTISYRNV